MVSKNPVIGCIVLLVSASCVAAAESVEAVQTAQELQQEQVLAAPDNDPGEDSLVAEWIPSAVEYDWVQLTSEEWLKGEIKGMYKDSLEFDSDKLDLLKIDWEDVRILRSYRPSSVNIEGRGAYFGILEVTEDRVTITSDGQHETFDRSRLISFAPGGESEWDFWSAKAVLGLDLRAGNTDQVDYTARLSLRRRAPLTRFVLDYIGNLSKTGSKDTDFVETVNNHRITSNFDYYKDRYFFYTPIFLELYRDPFTNIKLKTTVGAGAGYTLIDDGTTELSIAGGPAYVKTSFISVAAGEASSESTPALVLRTNYDTEVTSSVDFIARYNIVLGNQASGGYSHHAILTLETEITGSLDIDTSFIWDRTSNPAQASDGTIPETDDYRITLGLSYTY